MNAVPLPNISAEDCVDAFIRHWVTLFGTSKHIFTDRGTQFTSSFKLSMCNYLRAQQHHAKAYHPQARGQIERLNRTLKNSLRCQDNANEWYDNQPWALIAMRNSPKEDLGNFFPTDFVLGHSIRLPREFFHVRNRDGPKSNAFVSKFGHNVASLRFMPPRQADRAPYLDKNLFSPATTHVCVRVDSHRSPLQPIYQGPYKVLAKFSKYFKLDMQHGINNVSIDRIKTAHLSSVSSPIVTTARGRVISPPAKLRDYCL